MFVKVDLQELATKSLEINSQSWQERFWRLFYEDKAYQIMG